MARAIWTRRNELGLTRNQAAEKANISAHYWWELERGDKRPTTDKLAQVALALDLKPHELLKLGDDLSPPVLGAMLARKPMPAHTEPRETLAHTRRLADRLVSVLASATPDEAETALLLALGQLRAGAASTSVDPG